MTNIVRLSFVAVLAFLSAASYNPPSAIAAAPTNVVAAVCALQSNPEALADLQKNPKYAGVICPSSSAKPVAATTNKHTQAKQIAKAGPNTNPPAGKTLDNTPSGPFGFLLRNDWSDVGLLG